MRSMKEESGGPASMTRMRNARSSASRLAIAQPAEPAPMMM
jgi:hypothetical protein